MNITRCLNNYGPYHFPKKLIPLTISRVLNNEVVPVYGDCNNIGDWLHVFDHCTAIDLVLHEGLDGEIYNIGGVEDRLGHDKRYVIDSSKLEQLGWNPSGIHQTIQWNVENKDWLERIISGQYAQYTEK